MNNKSTLVIPILSRFHNNKSIIIIKKRLQQNALKFSEVKSDLKYFDNEIRLQIFKSSLKLKKQNLINLSEIEYRYYLYILLDLYPKDLSSHEIIRIDNICRWIIKYKISAKQSKTTSCAALELIAITYSIMRQNNDEKALFLFNQMIDYLCNIQHSVASRRCALTHIGLHNRHFRISIEWGILSRILQLYDDFISNRNNLDPLEKLTIEPLVISSASRETLFLLRKLYMAINAKK